MGQEGLQGHHTRLGAYTMHAIHHSTREDLRKAAVRAAVLCAVQNTPSLLTHIPIVTAPITRNNTRRDLRRAKPQSALLFNALFNLHKFLSFENRDPFAMRAEQGEFAGLSDWDKFAKIEYYRCGCACGRRMCCGSTCEQGVDDRASPWAGH